MDSVKQQIVDELYSPARRKFPRRKVKIKSFNDLFQADLVQLNNLAKENNQFKYILTVINAYSKYAWAVPLKNKTGLEVTAAFKKIFEHQTPINLHTDSGKEFFNKHFKDLTRVLGINHYITHSGLKASLVERFNKTLKNFMWKRFAVQGNYKWLGILPELIKKYNNTPHSTTGMKPCEVTPRTKLDFYDKRKLNIKPPKYSIGDYVRISKHKNVFAKGYQGNFSTEIFQVNQINTTIPVTYLLQDSRSRPIVGSFYEQEITKVKYPDAYLVEKIVRKKGKKVLVKWLGLPQEDNTWEDVNKMTMF